MKTLNRVTLLGHVGSNPEFISYEKNGEHKFFATLSLATDEPWRDENGKWQKETDWHKVVIFDENLVKLVQVDVQQGTALLIEGRLKRTEWKTKEAGTQKSYEIEVSRGKGRVYIIKSPEKVEKTSQKKEENIQ